MRRLLPSHRGQLAATPAIEAAMPSESDAPDRASGTSGRFRASKTPRLLLATAFLCLGPLAAAAHASPTRAEYVVQADPLCAAATRDIGRINRHFRHLPYPGPSGSAGGTLPS